LRDVCCDIDKARAELGRTTERLTVLKEQSAIEIKRLTVAQAKLSAATVVALLSTQGQK